MTTEAKAPAIVHTPREQWLAERREILGASEVAAVLGADSMRGAFSVWAEKVSDLQSEDRPEMRWGRRAEGLTADIYAEETGRRVTAPPPYEIQRHPDLKFLGCTLDRLTGASDAHPAPVVVRPRDGKVPLECKNAGPHKAAEWREEPPTPYVVQVQMQMACTGTEWGTLAALVGWPPSPVWVDLLRDDRFLAAAYPALEAFWLKVQRREAPRADGLPGTSEALRRLFPSDNGETIDLDGQAQQWMELLERARDEQSGAEDAAEELANLLKARMGSASFGRLPEGSYVTLKTTKRAGYTVESTTYRQLRRWRPKLKRR